MFYMWNVVKDVTYGYLEVKCCNRNCGRVFKISRNTDAAKYNTNVSCNAGCALAAYNHSSHTM